MSTPPRITKDRLDQLRIFLRPLVGTAFTSLSLPIKAMTALEPSQVGSMVGILMDALIPYLPDLLPVGLTKHEGILKDREGYPDYRHNSGLRIELKLIYVNNPALTMKRISTPRESSARVSQKVTVKNVDPALDALLVCAYQLRPQENAPEAISPTIVDYDVFSMIEIIEARDGRMLSARGRWFGNYETPTIPSKVGRKKLSEKVDLDTTAYGRKESEGRDFNEDTNFGKLKRIPHPDLQAFLRKHGVRE